MVWSLRAIASDLRQGGKYREALVCEEQAYAAFADLVRQRMMAADHLWVLTQAKGLATARRKMGVLESALELSEDVYSRFVAQFGERHPDVLAAAMSLGNARRVCGDVRQDPTLMDAADELLRATFELYREVYGPDHPCTHGCALNLAIVHRRFGDQAGARELLEGAAAGLQAQLGDDHHYTLTAMTNLATALVDTDDLEGATVLPEDHFDVADAADGRRVVLDFEPPSL